MLLCVADEKSGIKRPCAEDGECICFSSLMWKDTLVKGWLLIQKLWSSTSATKNSMKGRKKTKKDWMTSSLELDTLNLRSLLFVQKVITMLMNLKKIDHVKNMMVILCVDGFKRWMLAPKLAIFTIQQFEFIDCVYGLCLLGNNWNTSSSIITCRLCCPELYVAASTNIIKQGRDSIDKNLE